MGATVWELTNLAPLVAIPLPPQLLGFGSALLDNVDPNPENFVGAGIIQTKALQVGCLLRLEPNAQAQVSRGLEGPPERYITPYLLCIIRPPLVFLYPPTLIFVSVSFPPTWPLLSFILYLCGFYSHLLLFYHLAGPVLLFLSSWLPCVPLVNSSSLTLAWPVHLPPP